MSKIHVKYMTDTARSYIYKNIEYVTKMISQNDSNEWIYKDFPEPIFQEKIFEIDDFSLIDNPNSDDKTKDLKNSITIYEVLKDLPRYVLTEERFWLWLYFDKFYSVVKRMMLIKSESTVRDHWTYARGTRRGIFFGVLSRCYFRVALTIDESDKEDKYKLTKWIIENPERFRNLTWRSYSSEAHIVRGAIKGEMKAVADTKKEDTKIYDDIGKYISKIGSVRLLDAISEKDIEEMVYSKCIELLK